ncbi:MAG: restriction endonuclease subunit S [Nitrososphaera sp.]|nr:restriction endonuclease subunit S [Nitrososphaera sp.]
MAQHKSSLLEATEIVPTRTVEHFGVSAQLLRQSIRIDASHFNPSVAHALETLRRSGMNLVPLGEITKRVFIPPRFKRIYVDATHGIPFLQGSHIPHFQPADIKYLSTKAHKGIERWIVEAGWILVTCSGTVGRVTICPPDWHEWAASQHILRIIPNESACESGYLYSFLSSPLGYVQLTSRIYGAVVDELTEDQAKSVLVPLPTNEEQRKEVSKIDKDARTAIATWSRAVQLVKSAAAGVADLIYEDRHDADIAAQRLREIKQWPDGLVRGEKLNKVLAELEHQ